MVDAAFPLFSDAFVRALRAFVAEDGDAGSSSPSPAEPGSSSASSG